VRPRVLFVGRERFSAPLDDARSRKYEALSRVLDWRILGVAPRDTDLGDGFVLYPPDSRTFHPLLALRVARELRRFRPDAVIVQGVVETVSVLLARRLARVRTRVVLDVHGDWRTATRLYGSPLRRPLSPLLDALAPVAIRRADAIRTVSRETSQLVRAHGREPDAQFVAFVDAAVFAERQPERLPDRPRALFVGVLERYKNVDGLVDAWRLAAPRVPGAELHLVGRGPRAPLVEELVHELPAQTRWTPALAPREVARALDEAWTLVLPSRSEGLPRVAMEAFARGRAVVGSRVAGIPELVEDGVSGLLVDAADTAALADALVRVLSDRPLAERLGAAAHDAAPRWVLTADQWAEATRAVVDAALRRS
jgi:glycosyltransferase involved in cell wall biosynthesis